MKGFMKICHTCGELRLCNTFWDNMTDGPIWLCSLDYHPVIVHESNYGIPEFYTRGAKRRSKKVAAANGVKEA